MSHLVRKSVPWEDDLVQQLEQSCIPAPSQLPAHTAAVPQPLRHPPTLRPHPGVPPTPLPSMEREAVQHISEGRTLSYPICPNFLLLIQLHRQDQLEWAHRSCCNLRGAAPTAARQWEIGRETLVQRRSAARRW